MGSYSLPLLLSYILLLASCKAKVEEQFPNVENRLATEDTINKYQSDTAVHSIDPLPDVGEMTFDKSKWRTREGKDYPYREEMYKGLMTDTLFRSLKYDEVVSVLGKPDRSDGNYLFYTISQKRLGALPINTKTLVIKFKEDNTIEWIKLHG